jgi:4a-hydroxytetrahydrobiopterin dehydratase
MPLRKKKIEKALTEAQVKKSLEKLSSWEPNKKHTTITKTYEFPNFVAALAFLAKITVHAEVMNHHPVATLSYGKLALTLSTDRIGGLSASDFDLAKRIDGLSK